MRTLLIAVAFLFIASSSWSQKKAPDGFTTLFNGKDFTNWKVPVGDNGHWKILDGVIDYDAESEAEKDKNLWSDKEYEDFILFVDWRIKETPWNNPRVPIILPSGLHKLNEKGEEITITVPDSDSGILLRGQGKSQVNIWCWPTGSGEVYGYRKVLADHNIGEWNTFKITLQDDFLTVVLNGITVIENAYLPDLPEKGPIGLQHHGNKMNGEWVSPPALVQFRNIYIKEL